MIHSRPFAWMFVILAIPYCSESFRTVFEENRESGESVRLYKFDRQSVNEEGRTEWSMKAEEAYIYLKNDMDSKIVAYNFHFMQYDVATGSTLTDLSAGRGEIDYDNKKVYLSKGVKFKDSATKYGEAESMNYDMTSKIISSDERVVLYEDGRVTRCLKGIELDRENEREICKSPAVIQRQQEGSETRMDDIFD